MEALLFDAGTAGTAQGLFAKSQGQAGTKGGGLFAALLSLVGTPDKDTGQDQSRNGDASAATANAGLPGLLALLYPALNTDQTTGSATDALAAISADGTTDPAASKSQNAIALLAQALARTRSVDGEPLAGIDLAALGLDIDPATSANPAAGISLAGEAGGPAPATATDLNALLAELRTRAAAKFGDANGDAAVTTDGLEAAVRQAATTASALQDQGRPAWASSAGQDPRPLTPGLELALPAQAAPFGLAGSRGDKAAPALAGSRGDKAAPALAGAGAQAPLAATPAVAGGTLVNADPSGDSAGDTDAPTPGSGGGAVSTAGTALSGTLARGGVADGTNGTITSADPAATPFRAVEMQAPPTAKAPASSSAAPPAADARRSDPPAAPAPRAAADDGASNGMDDSTDATVADSDGQSALPAGGADQSADGAAPANAALADVRGQAGSSRATIQVPVERLTQFMTQPDQLALQIQRAAAGNRDHITIQLVPQDLGRIEVKLDFDKSGGLSAVIAADRPQTLDLLRRDAPGLERALQDAGFRADSGSLSFNLRGDQRQYQNPQGNPNPTPWVSSGTDSADRTYLPAYRFASTADAIRAAANGRVDIAV